MYSLFSFLLSFHKNLAETVKVNKYFVTGTSNSTTVHLWQNFYNIPTFNMKQLKKACTKKSIVVSLRQIKSNNHISTTLLRTLPVLVGKTVYETSTSNKIILVA